MLQNATSLRKSAPGSPDMSDSCVSSIAPATRHASLQILFKCPTPANVVETVTKPHALHAFGRVQNPLRLPHKTALQRQKVARTCGVFGILTSKCASRHNGAHF